METLLQTQGLLSHTCRKLKDGVTGHLFSQVTHCATPAQALGSLGPGLKPLLSSQIRASLHRLLEFLSSAVRVSAHFQSCSENVSQQATHSECRPRLCKWLPFSGAGTNQGQRISGTWGEEPSYAVPSQIQWAQGGQALTLGRPFLPPEGKRCVVCSPGPSRDACPAPTASSPHAASPRGGSSLPLGQISSVWAAGAPSPSRAPLTFHFSFPHFKADIQTLAGTRVYF